MSTLRRLRAFFLEPIEGFLSRLEAILVTHLHFQRITMDQLQHIQQSVATLQSGNAKLVKQVDILITSHADLKRQLLAGANAGGASSEMLMSLANQIDGANAATDQESTKVDAEVATDTAPPADGAPADGAPVPGTGTAPTDGAPTDGQPTDGQPAA